MSTLYKLQIVDAATEAIATFRGRGPVERELSTAIVEAVIKRGGWWLRSVKLRAAVAEAIEEVLQDIKEDATRKHFE